MFVVRCCQGEVRKENASRSVGQGSHAHMSGEVRKENASRSVGQGSHAHMSGEMQRYGGLNLYGLVM